jgi:MoaA/NifB/PqqE/SkfB family radical SAM enzyme
MIRENYVSFETAKLLKEKGFDIMGYASIKVFGGNTYEVNEEWITPTEDTIIPTLQMVMKWLREEKDVQIEITIVGIEPWEKPTKWSYGFRCQTKDVIDRRNADFSSYEEAAEAAIKHCLENLI